MSLPRIIKCVNSSITCLSLSYIGSKATTTPFYPNPSFLSIKSLCTLFHSLSLMGLVFGKISVETPKYEVIKSTSDYEIRKYEPSVVAEVTYDPSQFKGNKDGGFTVLANYIGALGNPQNTKPEKISMTAPVITKDHGGFGEKIAMTAPVVTKDGGVGGEEGKNKMVTMQFLLPAMYRKAEEAPKPIDERVVIREEDERKYGVVKFGGVATDKVVKEKVEKLRMGLEKDGFKVVGDFLLARYNPPWTIPTFRINEVMIPVE
ncbi:heme-binding-like protein At3g10130, chloroplastic [Abrus precatorius]|uniref:Heme-binding-like protein At3g10130, chloroplastic n=1 Tax=Abrus precatorius TaxID=3816 RepID=A0A8B8JV91_ABRPR|nr:heme-binding-like protein At3g10130, chloroplastic [Abrus precatorius]